MTLTVCRGNMAHVRMPGSDIIPANSSALRDATQKEDGEKMEAFRTSGRSDRALLGGLRFTGKSAIMW